MLYLYIAAGGAIGSVLRFLCLNGVKALAGRDFPWSTLAVNVIGSFLMGVLLYYIAQIMPKGRELWYLIGVGALGGFTTFSAFSYDSYMLLERGEIAGALLYMLSSVLMSVAALFIGMWLCKVAFL